MERGRGERHDAAGRRWAAHNQGAENSTRLTRPERSRSRDPE